MSSQGEMERLRRKYLELYGTLPLPVSGGDHEEEEDDDDDDPNQDDPPVKRGKDHTYSGDELNSILRSRLKRQKEKLTNEIKSDLQAQFEREKAENDKDLQKQLDIAKRELKDLDMLKSVVADFTDLADQQFEEALTTLPEAIRLLAPDDSEDPLTRQKWLIERALPAAKSMNKKGKAGDDEDSDDDKEEDKTPRNRSRAGFNPKEPKNRTKNQQERVEGIVKRFRGASTFDPM